MVNVMHNTLRLIALAICPSLREELSSKTKELALNEWLIRESYAPKVDALECVLGDMEIQIADLERRSGLTARHVDEIYHDCAQDQWEEYYAGRLSGNE